MSRLRQLHDVDAIRVVDGAVRVLHGHALRAHRDEQLRASRAVHDLDAVDFEPFERYREQHERGDAVFWDTGVRAQQLIESGEVDLAWMWSGRALAGIKNGADFAANWNDFSPVFDTLVVPVGAKNPQASFALINYMIGKSAQEKLTEATSYSPIHDEAQPQVDELTQSFITTAKPKEQALPIDNTWWSENQADGIKKGSDWLAG